MDHFFVGFVAVGTKFTIGRTVTVHIDIGFCVEGNDEVAVLTEVDIFVRSSGGDTGG